MKQFYTRPSTSFQIKVIVFTFGTIFVLKVIILPALELWGVSLR